MQFVVNVSRFFHLILPLGCLLLPLLGASSYLMSTLSILALAALFIEGVLVFAARVRLDRGKDKALQSGQMVKDVQSIQLLTAQKERQQAIFHSMREGVLVLDLKDKIIAVNRAAARLLKIKPEDACDRNLFDVVKNSELRQTMMARSDEGEFVEDVELLDEKKGKKFFEVRRVVFENEQGEGLGSLVVLNDVTRLKRLEMVKTDLVANVSHELKTPITSIKGFVETLLDGALEEPEDARRFLTIIARHSDRMTAIVEDLLTLARLEGHKVKELMLLQEERIIDIIKSAIDVCRSKAEDRNITLKIECDKSLAAIVDRSLIEQAIINLVDNAVKYSSSGGEVLIWASLNSEYLDIGVKDRGMGIERSHLPRLFERFYRVDKARSRQMGGTGLGLAIVKHIVSAHDGELNVVSEVGKGSEFRIRLFKGTVEKQSLKADTKRRLPERSSALRDRKRSLN